MDSARFDHLIRLLGSSGDRRAALGAILSAVFAGGGAASARKRGKHRGKDRDRNHGQGDALQAEGRGQQRNRHKGKGKGKNKKKRGAGGQTSPPAGCCGSKSCADPKAGSTRAECAYAGRNFNGSDLHGATLRGIDGRGSRFDQVNLRGAVLAEACLHGATFRSAHLAGSTWRGACLIGADFTGADLGGESAVFAGALFCNTTMPDGSRNDRDCDRPTSCCQRGEQPDPECRPNGGSCTRNSDCCGGNCFNRVCAATQQFCGNATCEPSAVGCCDAGGCCYAPANQCNPGGECCAPNCNGKQCGPDGCGTGGTCGTCADGQECDANFQCICTPRSCANGCCDGETCRSGTADQACGKDGQDCVACPAGQSCQNRICACAPACDGKDCGPNGCGGSCGTCAEGQRCQNGVCVCDAQSCPDGCCANGPGNPGACRNGANRQACGSGGERCVTCPQGQDCLNRVCAVCGPQTCPDGCCAVDGTCQGNAFGACGGPGGGPCASCSDSQTCQNGQCVECGLSSCTCSGQSICTDPSGSNLVCTGASDPQVCFCYVSRTGQPICGTSSLISPNGCNSDADCGAGGFCLDNTASGPCGANGHPFCVTPCCQPDCAGKVCGADGCGGACGTCPGALQCEDGRCVSTCTAQNCPNGCCDDQGRCQPGSSNQACGKGGAPCEACGEGTECLDQQCESCTPTTCQQQGVACGPLADGCGRTLQCGACPLSGDTPSCQDGSCKACADVCPYNCAVCIQSPDGTTECAGNTITFCEQACTSDADCAGSQFPRCVTSAVDRATGNTSSLPDECRQPDAAGICVSVIGCCQPDCTGKVCGDNGCGRSCGSCGECQACENGVCKDLLPSGEACTADGDCCSENCFNGVCAALVTQCDGTPCNPPARGCAGSTCCGDTARKTCGDSCCAAGAKCCGDQCCAADAVCCGNQCCAADASCCGSQCCGKNALCCTDAGTPYCCSNAICGCCNGACCCP